MPGKNDSKYSAAWRSAIREKNDRSIEKPVRYPILTFTHTSSFDVPSHFFSIFPENLVFSRISLLLQLLNWVHKVRLTRHIGVDFL